MSRQGKLDDVCAQELTSAGVGDDLIKREYTCLRSLARVGPPGELQVEEGVMVNASFGVIRCA